MAVGSREHSAIRLIRESTNETTLYIGELTIWFSYSTIVGFAYPGRGRVVSKNVWSVTTGKHLTHIDGGDKDSRLEHEEFKRQLREVLDMKFLTVED